MVGNGSKGEHSHFAEVHGSKMHYIDMGTGDPILFIHGMPTSSYLWRKIMPIVSPLNRCIAVDLIGMGWSDKPDITFSIDDHIKYLEKFIEILNLKKVILVMHGWGSIIGLSYAKHHEKNCRGLVFYESYLRLVNEESISLPYQEQLAYFHEQTDLYELLANGAYFVDKALPQGMLSKLSPTDMQYYREPFEEDGAGNVINQYLREIPKGNGRSKIDIIIGEYSSWLEKSFLPKLLLFSVPGFLTTMATIVWAKDSLPNLTVMEVGEELHYAQESSPELFGESISIWLQSLEQSDLKGS